MTRKDLSRWAFELKDLSWSDLDRLASEIKDFAIDDNGNPNDERYIARSLLDWADSFADENENK